MKHITRTALAVAGLALIGAAVLAGKDDIRKFRRMHSCNGACGDNVRMRRAARQLPAGT
jgi:hypothetical protein